MNNLSSMKKEELEKFIHDCQVDGHHKLANTLCELLARKAAAENPVAWMVGDATLYNPDTVEAYVKRSGLPVIPLFAGVPLPVVPDEMTITQAKHLHAGTKEMVVSFADGYNACRAAMLNHIARVGNMVNSPVTPDCWCHACRPVTINDSRFVACPDCANKRCPKANDHRNTCTGSNEPGQEGGAYPAPKPEVE